ncbi:hypothetical protein CHS0354_022701 [Potamilus streckersoni]|uniref:Puratrophin-1 n=1 Tax=Potamilus streckersoni TaxID=2493646 RepID=A0AAE0VIS5_9BIVA|nr:hypothetical protein CHS0354_022701 [Potamilus streckersoni]
MDWRSKLRSDSAEEIGALLQQYIACLEDSVHKLTWDEICKTPSASFQNTSKHFCHDNKTDQSDCICPENRTSPSNSNHSCHDSRTCQSNVSHNCHDNRMGLYNLNHECPDSRTGQSSSIQGCHSAGSNDHHNISLDQISEEPKHQSHHSDRRNSRSKILGNDSQYPAESRELRTESSNGHEVDKPASCPRLSARLHQHRQLDIPKSILDVDYNLLQSGVAVLPGSRNLDGSPVVFIFTSSSLWKNQQVRSMDLTRLIMYYHSVPRETARQRGLCVIADIRGSTASTINTLLESLYLFEYNIPQSISIAHLLADKHTQSMVLKSPVYDVHSSFQINQMLSPEFLYTYISLDQVPQVLDGCFQYNHEDWTRFHMRLDPFISNCRSVARYLALVMKELSLLDRLPQTSQEASRLIDHQESLIQSVFEDARLVRLQSEGEAIIHSLQKEKVHLCNSDDYRAAMDEVMSLYKHLQDSIMKLVRLSDDRLFRLQKCMQLKEFDEECSKILSWLHHQGNEHLQHHTVMADNLKAVRSQQKEFEKFYFSAMSHIEKGNDLLEEAGVLAQSGDFEEVTGYKELARMLKGHLQQFTEKLEETRERIEGTTKCYFLLDKTYEWALEAMKYVASMKMEHSATPEGLEKLICSLDHYLEEHPPINVETFHQMIDLAQRLGNEKLLEKCKVGKSRCEETQKMINLRQKTLKEAKEQLVHEQNNSALSQTSTGAYPSKCSSKHVEPKIAQNVYRDPLPWQPVITSTPSSANLCSRGNSYRTPQYSIASVSKNAFSEESSIDQTRDSIDTDIIDSNGDNMSCDRFSKGPKSVSDTKHSSSKESLTEVNNVSSPSISSSSLSPLHVTISPLDSIPPPNTSQDSDMVLSARAKPVQKVLKRATTAPCSGVSPVILEEDPISIKVSSEQVRTLQQNSRPNSLMTGSSDSLPSLPEEDEGVGNMDEFPRREWTPVPVNTHLMERSSNLPTEPFTDLKLSEAEIKSKRTLALIMSEMVQTERDYACALRFVIENYIPEMQREDVPQALRGKRNIIFGNIEKIYQFHQQYFLSEVQVSRRNPFQIGRYFLMHEQQFHLYALYNKNKPKSDALMAEYGKVFFRRKQLELGDKMDLSSYLLKPVQRMGKYALLIKQILKECPSTEPEYQDLKAAEDMVKFQLRHGNDLLAMDALRDCDVNLQEQGRLLRQDEFLVWQGRRKSMRHIFLFEDLILLSKTRRGRNGGQDTYYYRHSLKMSDIGLTENYGESGYKFEIWFRRRSSGENYVMQAPNSEVKKIWVKEISKLLWTQAIKNREVRLTEMANLGIGNKPCLDIKPSADNIQDRFINIDISNKARTRNSVAVTSSEHLRQNNKRPYSVISISSTSSSNSSHSGFGILPGPYNLAFDPLDSPSNYRKSLTFMSSESGIGTDISLNDVDSSLKLELQDYLRPQSPKTYIELRRPKANLASCSEEVTEV